MTRSTRVQHALVQSVLLLFAVLDLVTGRDQVVLSLVVIAPLVAATTLGRKATIGYGALAFATGVLLGVVHDLYAGSALAAQVVRLFGIALGTAVAVVACTLRLRREAELARVSARAATDRAVVQVARTLQRELLGQPHRLPGLEVAVRYVPATRHAQVGGDWYDVFPGPDGRTVLVIGDVAGHDAPAAATMAQVRGMLRGVASAVPGPPSTVLTVLDRALAGLGMRTLVTAAVVSLDPVACGSLRIRWSNAGHPAPVLIAADGPARLLSRAPDRLLGVTPGGERRDHEATLAGGDTLLLYTDGLVERRGTSLDDGTAWLLDQVRHRGREPLPRLCDGLLGALGGQVDDDVALLAVRPSGCAAERRSGRAAERPSG